MKSPTRSYPVLFDMPQKPKEPLKPHFNDSSVSVSIQLDGNRREYFVDDFEEIANDYGVLLNDIALDLEYGEFRFTRSQNEEEKLIAQQEYETALKKYELDLIAYKKEMAGYNEKLRKYYLDKAASIK